MCRLWADTVAKVDNFGVGHLTVLAFPAAVDDPERFRRSRDLGAYLGLVPRRYHSGEVDYTGSISKCGDQALQKLSFLKITVAKLNTTLAPCVRRIATGGGQCGAGHASTSH